MAGEPQPLEASSYLVRLQAKIGSRFHNDTDCLEAMVLGRSVSIKSPSGPLSESDWIVLEACGFSSEEDAQEFGEQLRILATIAGLCAHLGIDAGKDTTLGQFSDHLLRQMGLEHDVARIPPQIHGVLVLPDDGKSLFVYASATLSVRSDPAQLLEAVETLSDPSCSFDVSRYPDSLVNSLTLLNHAIISDDRRAKIVLSIAAVESLISNQNWSDKQQLWLNDTVADLNEEDDCELREIADRIQSMYRISLRKGVFRLLEDNGLEEYKSRWDDVYGKRSGLFHGTLVLHQYETHRLANDAVKLCVTIVLTILRNRGVILPRIAAVHFSGLDTRGRVERFCGSSSDG